MQLPNITQLIRSVDRIQTQLLPKNVCLCFVLIHIPLSLMPGGTVVLLNLRGWWIRMENRFSSAMILGRKWQVGRGGAERLVSRHGAKSREKCSWGAFGQCATYTRRWRHSQLWGCSVDGSTFYCPPCSQEPVCAEEIWFLPKILCHTLAAVSC